MFDNNIGDDLKWGEIFYDVLLSTITKTCFTLRSGWWCGWEGSPKRKLTGFGFGRSAPVCCCHHCHILTERIAKYFINLCLYVPMCLLTINMFPFSRCLTCCQKVKPQCWILHPPWTIATGSIGWRSKSSWRKTESVNTIVVCREHGGRCQRGRLLQGGGAGSPHGVDQPAQACRTMWGAKQRLLHLLPGRREPAGGLSTQAGSRLCSLGNRLWLRL